eukprot:6767909-Prymnesium_polylepis.1
MAWVHVECLDHWRKCSSNPRSFYRCDNCLFEYRFGRVSDRLSVARFLGSRFAVHAFSLLALLCLVFVAGFAAKTFNRELTWWEVLRCFNLEHFISGATLTGLGSALGWLTSLLGGGGLRLLVDVADGVRGGVRADDKFGAIVVAVLVVVGLTV